MLSTIARSVVLTLAIAAGTIVGSPIRVRTPYAVKESHNVPSKWSRVGPAPADHLISLSIGLKSSQFDELERHLYEVSNPSHHRYGQHLTQDEVNELVKPTDDALDLVSEWLSDNGVTSGQLRYSPAKDWIMVTLPVSEVERLLDTEYSVYGTREGSYLVRTPEWSLPKHLHDHIDVIQPTNSFFRPTPLHSNVMPVKQTSDTAAFAAMAQLSTSTDLTVAQACNVTAVTPTCLRTLYRTINYTPQMPGQNRIGLNDFLGETNNRSDVHIFLEMFRKGAAAASSEFIFEVVNDGSTQQTPDNATQLAAGTDLEGNLDAETIIGITYPTPLTCFTTGGSPPFKPDLLTPTDTNEPYLAWLNFVLGMTANNLPQTISTSYGDDEQTVPPSFAAKACSGFAQLGARGVTLLFASGDNGVGVAGDCFSNDGKNTSMFVPSFPASCPYVTTVGATKDINPEVTAFDAENGFSSGGGFSNYFARPSYQDPIVPSYIASLGGEYNGLYNKSGRGYPDIAAQGYRFLTIWNGTIVVLDGTSAATPTAASVISLVNDALIAAGKPTLGFLNPMLYSLLYESFNDITSGSSIGCNTTGFPAKAGWDAATGFGTPDFIKIKAAALNAQT
ncbi:hypothetical protein MMC18_003440 [Xylographa bjoerkii]|nr:hypothetical protein [Xylographa bjoerkii]